MEIALRANMKEFSPYGSNEEVVYIYGALNQSESLPNNRSFGVYQIWGDGY